MIVIFDPDSGEIKRTVECPPVGYLSQVNEGEGHILSDIEQALFDIESHYIVDGSITPRPELGITMSRANIAANGTDTCNISGIPEGATVTSNEFSITADGSDLEFATDIPGEHVLKISLWPYMDAEVTINAL